MGNSKDRVFDHKSIMSKKLSLPLILGTTLALTLINVDLFPSSSPWVSMGEVAQARKSGGRSGGGSFHKSSGSSDSKSTKPSTSSYPKKSRSKHRPHVEIEIESGPRSPVYSHSNNSGGGAIRFLFSLILIGVIGVIIFAIIKAYSNKNNPSAVQSANEVNNNLVTLTKLQIAFLATAKDVQSQLSELVLRVDTNTHNGLEELLQESILILLRHSDYWTHALSYSKSTYLNQADQKFNELSIAERSKLTSETLTNMNGKIQQGNLIHPENEDSDFIVVTLLVGSAHDRPLVGNLHSSDEVKQALQKLASMSSEYLLKLEVIWSPQMTTDTLSYDEFVLEYTDMVQLV